MFAELQSHYLFADRFGRPGKGNDKGKVEGLVGYVRRNFMTPFPVADSFDALNARFLDACMKRRQAILRGQATTIGERMQADTSAFMPLPPAPYDACHKVATHYQGLVLSFWRHAGTLHRHDKPCMESRPRVHPQSLQPKFHM